MICREYKCVFIHIPRTGGQSVEHFFLDLVGLTWEMRAPLLLRYNPDPARGPERLAHLTASEYVSFGYLEENQFKSFYKFSFVRNPWDRIVSEYRYRRHARRGDFKSFLFRNLPTAGMNDQYRHILPQYEFIFDENGDRLVDYIGRFEKLQTDFDLICKHLGIAVTALPHVNASSDAGKVGHPFSIKVLKKTVRGLFSGNEVHKCYTEYYDDESREFVSVLYKKDIEAFGYTFGA